MSQPGHIPNLVSIAGVDPSGGAGVLADLKTFSALGAYGCGVIAALTAQNTRAVTGIHEVPPEFLRLQLDTLFEDVRIDAVKIGMLASGDLIRVVADALRRYRPAFVVLDPVMVAKSGDRLLRADAVEALRTELLPLATVLTPNLPEAGDLLGRTLSDRPEDMREAAAALHALGPKYVLVKGGHGSGPRGRGRTPRRPPLRRVLAPCASPRATPTAPAARCPRRSPRCCRNDPPSRTPFATPATTCSARSARRVNSTSAADMVRCTTFIRSGAQRRTTTGEPA